MEEQHEQEGYQASHEEHRKQRDSATPNPYVIPFSIVLAGVIIAGAIMFANRGESGQKTQLAAQVGDTAQNIGDTKALEINAPMLGKSDAPVSIIEFADFQCPFCGRFYETTGKQIIETYVKAGKVKLFYHDFAFLGDESEWAAQAARCAGDQGKYWQYHDYLYEHQKGENEGAFSKDHLKGFALAIGLNAGTFNSCLDSGKHAKEVKDDTEAGRKYGVSGTPSSFVNGKMITGAVPFSQFQTAIEEALKGK